MVPLVLVNWAHVCKRNYLATPMSGAPSPLTTLTEVKRMLC